jgi:hypothetical protein
MTTDLILPQISIIDLFTKSGKHLKTTTRTLDGTLISEEGPNPNKDVQFLYSIGWRDTCPPQ